jgi:DNA-binding NtrC family response regulator
MGTERQLRSAPQRNTSENQADISEGLSDRAYKSELTRLTEIALMLVRGLRSFEQTANESKNNLNFKEQVAEFESRLIRNALIRSGGRQNLAARALGIKATTLHNKIKRYGIDISLTERSRS